MTQPTQRLDLSLSVNYDGTLNSLYPAGDKPAAYQLASGYYTPTRFALEAFWPRPLSTVASCLIYNSSKSNKALAVFDFGGVLAATAGTTLTLTFPVADASNALIRIA